MLIALNYRYSYKNQFYQSTAHHYSVVKVAKASAIPLRAPRPAALMDAMC